MSTINPHLIPATHPVMMHCAPPNLVLCTYNVFEGFRNMEESRLRHFYTFLSWSNPDLIGLQELNGVTREQLQQIGSTIGMPHTQLQLAKTGFHLGLMSKHPITVHDTSALEMHHGLLHAEITIPSMPIPLHILITHLTPRAAKQRRLEVATVLHYYTDRLLDSPTVLMGDLNTLSPRDAEAHHHSALRDKLSQDIRLATKFLGEALPGEERSIDYEPITMLEDAGLVDCGGGDSTSPSVPTAVNDDPAHAARMRLDFILMSHTLVGMLTDAVAVTTVNDKITNLISDHYPVVLTAQPQITE